MMQFYGIRCIQYYMHDFAVTHTHTHVHAAHMYTHTNIHTHVHKAQTYVHTIYLLIANSRHYSMPTVSIISPTV